MNTPKLSFSSLVEPLESRIAPATVSPNGKNITWTDIDGDIAKLHASRAIFAGFDKNPDALNSIFTFSSSGSGEQLQLIDFTHYTNPAFVNGISIDVSAFKPMNGTGDGKVNVGFIKAAIVRPDDFAIKRGIDFGRIKIQGDLGGLYAGDQNADTAVGSIDVQSWGKLNAAEQAAKTAGTIPTDLHSIVLGPIGKITIGKGVVGGGDFDGTYGARLQVLGGQFGTIGSIHITGSVIGGAADKSGQIYVTKRMGDVKIDGSLIGGGGENSATLFGDDSAKTSFGNITIDGDLQGGTGNFSGSIFTSQMGKVEIKGDIAGYAGNAGDSSVGSNSANIQGVMKSLHVKGSILGGSGENSGRVVAQGTVDSVRIDKNIQGGSASGSGGLVVSFLRHGVIGTDAGDGDVIGGDAASGTVSRTGYVLANTIQNLELHGDLKSGTAANGATLIASGAITAISQIRTLTIDGDVIGNSTAVSEISAGGLTTGKSGLAIKALKIEGSVDHANILAGYTPDTSFFGGFQLQPVNGDAQIGAITIGANISATNIVAGATRGTDGIFGTADDVRITGTGTTDRLNVFSSIASIIVTGQATTSSSGGGGFGIVSDRLGTVAIGNATLSLTAGPNNDTTPISIPGTTDFHAIELTAPAPSNS